ncbi:dipeptidyl aminopeptidase/acylaminoacyl peptidase [Amycolatopsis sulphurea]|uniref:Dipeptidyl aminopeptidase/acylaminoacyl peptidase n=1 Tax=Amycolatopsis sulphurea TaxID=76022 RepID=A0A2A9FFA6_9PSEU|nr:alpha/beta fold hydrolase [Amycolatopsis sulphurea]PFG49848.1 dipeptidyl aminopeptidase/acylaminoacyl peptidase [Amycolatopsis sulphurea]
MPENGAPAGSLPRLISVEELFADPKFSSASISPDGTKLAYLAEKHGRLNVWIRGVDEEHEDAVCVTHTTDRAVNSYFWTDDPRWLVYRKDSGGNEDWHLYRVDLEAPDEPALDLTPLEPGGRAMSFTLLKGRPGTVLITMNPRVLYFDLFEVDLATGAQKLVWEQPHPLANVIPAADGTLRFRTQLKPDGIVDYHAIDPDGTERLILAEGGLAYPVGHYPLLPTPDGSGLLVGSYQDGDDLRLVRVDANTGEQMAVAAEPGRSVCDMGMFTEDFGYPPSVMLSSRTGEVVAVRFVGDRPALKVIDPEYAEIFAELAALSEGEISSVSSDEAEQRWVVSFIHDRDPGVTYYYDRATRASKLLCREHPELDPAELAPMTAVGFPARDGLPLHAFLTLPVGVEPKNLPLVLYVHGGPWAHDLWGYHSEVQLMANRGYAVLQVNFRGSSGYGRKHITSAVKELAGKMHDDLIDAVNWAVEQGYADPKRLGIYGGSYGGYATLVGVTVTPDTFAAAVDYVGVSSLVGFMGKLPDFVKPSLVNNWLAYAGDPENPEERADMLARSPITMVDRIRTPLLVVQGANDARVAKSESDAIVEGLRERGVPVEYLVAEDEGHAFINPENLNRMYYAIERHFGEHLGGRQSGKDS